MITLYCLHEGQIVQVTHVYAYWHRNNNRRRPRPKDSGLDRLLNWRLYKQWSGGLLPTKTWAGAR